MKMNKKLLRIASVFFVLLALIGCGVMTIFFATTTISRFTWTNQFKVTIDATSQMFDLIGDGNGPSLFLGYVVTGDSELNDYSSITTQFDKQYRHSPFGIHLTSGYHNGPILEVGSSQLKLFAFSGTTLTTPEYHATSKKSHDSSEEFSIELEKASDNSYYFVLKSSNDRYTSNISRLTRYNGKGFPLQLDSSSQYDDYITGAAVNKFCHFFAAINVGKGEFNNIYWSTLRYLGSIQIGDN
jgi:hypothetical protein